MKITDPIYIPRNHDSLWERVALKFIQDPRDLPFVVVIAKVLALFPAFAAFLFLEKGFHWWHGAIYLGVIYGVFFSPVILMLHNTSHRAFFKSEYRWMKALIPWLVAPFVGSTPETYFAHHIGMHHVEDNLPPDLSSTMKYRRDGILDFLHYYFTFMLIGLFQLTRYFQSKKRWKFVRNLLAGELTYFAVAIFLTTLNWRAAVTVFWLPLVMTRFFMMAGNWAQHAFIDQDSPSNNYRNSITAVNSRFNQVAFNDGYHIGHHLKSSMHWTDMPVEFQKNAEAYVRERAIVFEGLDWGVIWFLLMTHSYRTLAKHVISPTGQPLNLDEVEALLRSRTAPFAVAVHHEELEPVATA
ncbi:MAG: fatty acid desaturase family protein [Bdellovibrionota bacterium]